MKNLTAGVAGIALCQIPFTEKTVEIIIQAIIALSTLFFQFKNNKKKTDGSN